MPAPESLFWVAAVTIAIWLGIFLYCLGLERRLHKLEEEEGL
jgi:CcmD family protein